MKTLVRMRSQGKYDWKNEVCDFGRLPNVGEYITLGADAPWYLVQLVVHTPYPHGTEAELYTVQVDASVIKHQALHGKT